MFLFILVLVLVLFIIIKGIIGKKWYFPTTTNFIN
jgi:hypothetical protein